MAGIIINVNPYSMANQYTEDQLKDITAREAEAIEHLKRLQLTPAAQVVKERISNDDIFADRVIPYLADTKYTPVPSPLSK